MTWLFIKPISHAKNTTQEITALENTLESLKKQADILHNSQKDEELFVQLQTQIKTKLPGLLAAVKNKGLTQAYLEYKKTSVVFALAVDHEIKTIRELKATRTRKKEIKEILIKMKGGVELITKLNFHGDIALNEQLKTLYFQFYEDYKVLGKVGEPGTVSDLQIIRNNPELYDLYFETFSYLNSAVFPENARPAQSENPLVEKKDSNAQISQDIPESHAVEKVTEVEATSALKFLMENLKLKKELADFKQAPVEEAVVLENAMENLTRDVKKNLNDLNVKDTQNKEYYESTLWDFYLQSNEKERKALLLKYPELLLKLQKEDPENKLAEYVQKSAQTQRMDYEIASKFQKHQQDLFDAFDNQNNMDYVTPNADLEQIYGPSSGKKIINISESTFAIIPQNQINSVSANSTDTDKKTAFIDYLISWYNGLTNGTDKKLFLRNNLKILPRLSKLQPQDENVKYVSEAEKNKNSGQDAVSTGIAATLSPPENKPLAENLATQIAVVSSAAAVKPPTVSSTPPVTSHSEGTIASKNVPNLINPLVPSLKQVVSTKVTVAGNSAGSSAATTPNVSRPASPTKFSGFYETLVD